MFASQTALMALMALQLFNAVFIGTIAGLGMLWFQDVMRSRPGAASTIFANSISTGMVLAGVIQGMLSERLGRIAVCWLALGLVVKEKGNAVVALGCDQVQTRVAWAERAWMP